MYKFLFFYFIAVPVFSFSQENNAITKKTNGINISIPLIKGLVQLDQQLSEKIHTKGTDNVITFLFDSVDISNHLTIYSIQSLSQYHLSLSKFSEAKTVIINRLQNEPLVKDLNSDLSKPREVLLTYYKNDETKKNEIIQSFNKLQGSDFLKYFNLSKPETVFQSDYGYINLYTSILDFENIKYYIGIVNSGVLLNNHYFGLSGIFDAPTLEEYNNAKSKVIYFFSGLIKNNPSIKN